MVISHLMQSSKELIKANSNILDNIIKCVNAFTTTKINASRNDILKGSLILFLGKISVESLLNSLFKGLGAAGGIDILEDASC